MKKPWGITGVKELKFDNGGSTIINGNITTTGKQTYSDAVTVSGTRTLSAGATDISFNSSLDGSSDLTVSTTGATTFSGVVGGATPLTTLTTAGAGTLNVNAPITTTGAQTYAEAMVLGGNVMLAGSVPTFNATTSVTGGGYDLALNFSGAHTIDGDLFTGIRHLSTGTAGGVTLRDTISTTGRQTYSENVTLAAATALTASDITLGGTVTGSGFDLALIGTGVTTIGGAISGVAAFVTNGGGSTILSANLTTTGVQTYVADVVVLGANVVLDSGGVTLMYNVAGAGKNLTLQGAGDKSFNAGAVVSGIQNLAVSTGAITFNGGTLTTSGTQTFSSPITLATAAQTLVSTGSGSNGDISFNAGATINGGFALTVNSSGTTSFLGTVGNATDPTGLTVGGGGTTLISANLGAAASGLTITDAVSLGANVVLDTTASGTVTLGSTVNGNAAGRTLTITPNSNAAITLGGAIGGTTPLATLTTSGTSPVALNQGTVTTTGDQVYGGLVTLGANTTLTTTAGGIGTFTTGVAGGGFNLTLSLSGGFGPALDPAKLNGIANFAIENPASNTVMLGGTLTTSGSQTFNQNFQINGNFVNTSTGGGNITFNAHVTSGTARTLTVNTSGTTSFENLDVSGLGALTTDSGGTTVITGSVIVDGAIVFNDALILGNDTTIATTGNQTVNFNSTLNGAKNLTVNSGTGTTTFGSAVGGTTALTSLTKSGTGGVVSVGVTTTAGQSYGGTVTLTGNSKFTGTTLVTAAGGFNGTGANFDLTLNFTGAMDALGSGGDAVTNVGKFTTGPVTGGGTTTLNGTITTSGSQHYNDAVSLAGGTTLTSSASGNAGSIYFGSTVDGTQTLTVNSDGITTFRGAVGGVTPLASLYTDDFGGGADINEKTVLYADVTTTGATGTALFYDTLTLAADVTITGSHTTPTVAATHISRVIGEGRNLTLVASGGGINSLGLPGHSGVNNLVSNGTAYIGADITTTGNQTYNGAVEITNNNKTLTGAAVSFSSTIASNGGTFNFTMNFSGTTALNGANISGFAALTLGGGGATTLTGALTTTGAMTFNDAIQLVGNTTLTSGNTAITFNSTVNSDSSATPRTLTLVTSAAQTFAGAVGNLVALGALDTGTGGITISGGSINTSTSNQVYDGAITLGANASLTGGALTLAAGGVAGASKDLTLNFSGVMPTLGTTRPISSVKNLSVGGGGSATLDGTISTSGTQTWNDAVTLGADLTLASTASGSAGNITINGSVNGAFALTVNTQGTTTFGGTIGATTPLQKVRTDAGGGTTVSGGSIRTVLSASGDGQVYNDTVTLANGTVFDSGASDLRFHAATAILGGGHNLTLKHTTSSIVFEGNVSGVNNLVTESTFGQLFYRAAAGPAITISTTGFQVYKSIIRLNADTTLSGTSVTSFNTAINAPGTTSIDGRTLTVNIIP